MSRSTPEHAAVAGASGHEAFDLDVRAVAWFALAIALLLLLTAATAYAMLGGFSIVNPTGPMPSAPAGPGGVPLARLQSSPQQDLRAYREQKAQALDGYRWIDRAAGIVQIPIERAMELQWRERPVPGAPRPAPPARRRP